MRPYLDLDYRNPDHPDLGIECFRLSELRRRMPAGFFQRVQRPRFHLLSRYEAGEGVQEIDFVARRCRPGTVLHVHPGQVLRYVDVARAEAQLVLFRPEFAAAEAGAASWIEGADVGPGLAALAREYGTTDGGGASAAIMRHLLAAVLLQLDRAAPGPGAADGLFARFQEALERSFRTTRRAQDYADALGCSVRTLNRATLKAAGTPLKRFIDQRVALEAKRLLAHTAAGVGEVGEDLGFSEPTNFVKFFRREVGQAPGAFQAAYRP